MKVSLWKSLGLGVCCTLALSASAFADDDTVQDDVADRTERALYEMSQLDSGVKKVRVVTPAEPVPDDVVKVKLQARFRKKALPIRCQRLHPCMTPLCSTITLTASARPVATRLAAACAGLPENFGFVLKYWVGGPRGNTCHHLLRPGQITPILA